MATVIRGPLYVGRREVPPVLAVSAFAVSSLLCTITAIALTQPLPNGERNFPAQDHVRAGLFPNPDTSRGSPKTLLPADPRQQFLPLQLPPQAKRGLFPNPDTSESVAKVLLPELVKPRGTVPPFYQRPEIKNRNWLPADTTQDMPTGLRPAQTPFVPPPHLWSGEHGPKQWINASTAQGTPKVLIPELRLPTGKAALGVLLLSPWEVVDTSNIVSAAALASLAAPIGEATLGFTQFYAWQSVNTTLAVNPNLFPPDTTVVVPPTPGDFHPGEGGGKRERQRRIIVEIDGEEFTVRSEAEAQALLAQVRALAKDQAEVAAKTALNRARKLRRKTGGLRLPTLEVAIPEIRVLTPQANPDIAAMFVAAQQAIDEIYLRSAQALEMAYLARREYEISVDDDEVMDILLRGE